MKIHNLLSFYTLQIHCWFRAYTGKKRKKENCLKNCFELIKKMKKKTEFNEFIYIEKHENCLWNNNANCYFLLRLFLSFIYKFFCLLKSIPTYCEQKHNLLIEFIYFLWNSKSWCEFKIWSGKIHDYSRINLNYLFSMYL